MKPTTLFDIQGKDGRKIAGKLWIRWREERYRLSMQSEQRTPSMIKR